MLVYTLGFIDQNTLLLKFDKHVTRQREFTYANPDEYETNADRFLGEPLDAATTEQCDRRKRDNTVGDRLRYCRVTDEFGALANDNYIRSYFVPNPARHGKATNLDYHNEACLEVRD